MENTTEEIGLPMKSQAEEDEISGFVYERGETEQEVVKRVDRLERLKKICDYRDVVPCDRCKSAKVVVGFDKKGQGKKKGLWCLRLGCEVKADATCDSSVRGDFVRVIVDMENAPMEFRGDRKRLALEMSRVIEGRKVDERTESKLEQYRGGRGLMTRARGNGSGEIPRGLAN